MRWIPVVLLSLVLGSGSLDASSLRLGYDGFRVGHRIEDAVLSSDGLHFAVKAGPDSVFLLDAATGVITQRRHGFSCVDRLAFGPTGALMIHDRVGTLTHLNPRTGQILRQIHLPQSQEVIGGDFHAGGRVWHQIRKKAGALRATDDQDFLDPATGEPLPWAEWLWADHQWALSSDGTLLATVRNRPVLTDLLNRYASLEDALAEHHLLRVLDTRNGKVLYQRRILREEVGRVAFTTDGRSLVFAVYPRLLVVDLATGSERELNLQGRAGRALVEPFHFSPDSKRVALLEPDPGEPTSSRCASVQVQEWDLASGRLLGRCRLTGERRSHIGYTRAGRLWIWNGHGCRLNICDREGGPLQPARGHEFPLRAVTFSADGGEVISRDEHDRVCRWECRSGKLLETHIEPPPESDRALTSPDGRWQVNLLPEEQVAPVLIDRRSGRQTRLPPSEELWPASRRALLPPFFSEDGRFLAEVLTRQERTENAPAQQVLIIYKTSGAKRIGRIPLAIDALRSLLLFGPQGDWVVCSTEQGVCRFDVRSGQLRQVIRPPTSEGLLESLALSPDGRYLLALVSTDQSPGAGELRLIELAGGSTRRAWPWHQTRRSSALPCFSPDGQRIAVPLDDGTILLLPTASERPSPDRENLWRDLASLDASVAGAAQDALAERPDWERWLRARYPVDPGESELNALFWLAELEHDDPRRREAARDRLARHPALLTEVESLLTRNASPDLRRLLTELREPTNGTCDPEELRRLRLAEVAERRGRR